MRHYTGLTPSTFSRTSHTGALQLDQHQGQRVLPRLLSLTLLVMAGFQSFTASYEHAVTQLLMHRHFPCQLQPLSMHPSCCGNPSQQPSLHLQSNHSMHTVSLDPYPRGHKLSRLSGATEPPSFYAWSSVRDLAQIRRPASCRLPATCRWKLLEPLLPVLAHPYHRLGHSSECTLEADNPS